jgi:hypothetical protein
VSTLQNIAAQFSVSKPVFVAELEKDGSTVDFIVSSVPVHDTDNIKDPVAKLIADRFRQSFDTTSRQFVQTTHMPSIYSDIVDSISLFYEKHSSLKNPTQSRLYKWLHPMNNQDRHVASEGFIALYRYIETKGGMYTCGRDVVGNVLAILEIMREKYEVE